MIKLRRLKFWLQRAGGATFIFGLLLVLAAIGAAVFAPQLAPYDPLALSLTKKLLPPSAEHLMGTDELGRDVLSRVIYGSRISLQVSAIILSIAMAIGVLVGLVSGYAGGAVDSWIMRLTDIFLAFPSLLLAMAISAALGGNLYGAVLGVALASWPGYARLARGEVLARRDLLYVEAARAAGATPWRVAMRHMLPNIVSPLMVKATVDVGYAIMLTASLSFVGLGARTPTPEWGSMVTTGRNFIFAHWWYPTFPGLAIFGTVLGFALIGDGLRDVWDRKA